MFAYTLMIVSNQLCWSTSIPHRTLDSDQIHTEPIQDWSDCRTCSEILPLCHGTTSLLPFLISFSLCLCPTPSLSPSESIRPRPPAFHSHLPAFCRLCSNSKVYLCNYATS